MPRRTVLSAAERNALQAIPDDQGELIRRYTFSESDLALIRMRRGEANRLGFAVQLCLLRFPGMALSREQAVSDSLIHWVARTLWMDSSVWHDYARRDETRREHYQTLLAYLQLKPFGLSSFRLLIGTLTELALQTDKGILLAAHALDHLRNEKTVIPPLRVIDRACANAVARANRKLHRRLVQPLTPAHCERLDELLSIKPGGAVTWLLWIRQSPMKPNSRTILEHIERLRCLQKLELPDEVGLGIHRNRLLKMSREGAQMTPRDLGKFENDRRHATLTALALEGTATLTDEIIDLHDRIMIKLFATAKNKHKQQFQKQGKAINDKVRLFSAVGHALVNAKDSGEDPYAAIERIISWDEFVQSVTDADGLSRPGSFDHIHLVANQYSTLRRYTPDFYTTLAFHAAVAARPVLNAVDVLRAMHQAGSRVVPVDAPVSFIRARWKDFVITPEGIDRCFYEICVLNELKNALRSGDIWVRGSRQFRNFDDYLLPVATFRNLVESNRLPLEANLDGDRHLNDRLATLTEQLATVNTLAGRDELPDASFIDGALKLTPQATGVPPHAQAFVDKVSRLLPQIKITELLVDVDEWTAFSNHFVHLKTEEPAKDRTLLLAALLADGINLGLSKMAASSPGMTFDRLSWLQAWHIRDETYTNALATLVNAQLQNPFAQHWGDGSTSSSDGQRFRTSNRGEKSGQVNPRYGSSPGRQFYTHISDQYSPFSSKVINVGIRDSTYVLDGLLYHESDLRIEEHYTDTAGFTDHVFALMNLLGYRFAPRIRDLKDTRLYVPKGGPGCPELGAMVGGTINSAQVRLHWDEILRLASSIKQGTVTASLMIRKLGSYPRQNGLSVALRELGRIERSLFILEYLQNIDLRKRVQAGLNKGEARNALARAVFFNRLGEIRDRSFEQQRHRASGLNLITAAIVLWNTIYIERAVEQLRIDGEVADEELLQYLSPLGWDHINLTGDYVWSSLSKVEPGQFRPLRSHHRR